MLDEIELFTYSTSDKASQYLTHTIAIASRSDIIIIMIILFPSITSSPSLLPLLPIQTQQVLHIPPRINPNPLAQSLGPPPRSLPSHPRTLARPSHAHRAPHPTCKPSRRRALFARTLCIPRLPHKECFSQLVCVELHRRIGCVSGSGVFSGCGVRWRQTHPDDPPSARGFARSLDFGEVAACAGDRG